MGLALLENISSALHSRCRSKGQRVLYVRRYMFKWKVRFCILIMTEMLTQS